MAQSSIDIAESLARLSAATIFELRGEWRWPAGGLCANGAA
jgi:hypothetical protein